MGSLRTLLIAIVFTVALSACATPPVGTSDSWCATNDPKRYTVEERAELTPKEKSDALWHNRFGALACGWKP
jgi:hypothetical protein